MPETTVEVMERISPSTVYVIDPHTFDWTTGVSSQFTEEQRKNYALLRDGLRMVRDDDFHMGQWIYGSGILPYGHGRYVHATSPDSTVRADAECDTAACAAGWAPKLGIGNIQDYSTPFEKGSKEILVDYDSYTEVTFGVSPSIEEDLDKLGVWNWIFDTGWSTHDDTASGAAIRIDIMLNYGIPDSFRVLDPFMELTTPLVGETGFYDWFEPICEIGWLKCTMPAVQMSDVLAGKASTSSKET